MSIYFGTVYCGLCGCDVFPNDDGTCPNCGEYIPNLELYEDYEDEENDEADCEDEDEDEGDEDEW